MTTTHYQNQLCLLEQRMPIFGELIVFQHLNIDFTIFFNGNISDLSKLSLSLKTKQ